MLPVRELRSHGHLPQHNEEKVDRVVVGSSPKRSTVTPVLLTRSASEKTIRYRLRRGGRIAGGIRVR